MAIDHFVIGDNKMGVTEREKEDGDVRKWKLEKQKRLIGNNKLNILLPGDRILNEKNIGKSCHTAKNIVEIDRML